MLFAKQEQKQSIVLKSSKSTKPVACPRGGSGCSSTPLSSGTTARSVAQWQLFMLIIDRVLFYDTFQHLQEDGKLNPLNEVDMYCLHYVFLPRINKALESFVVSWNNHPVSTEHNRTPNQLFVEGALQQATSGGPPRSSGTSLPTSHDPVQVPRSSFTPCAVLKTDVDRVDILKDSNNFGIDIYNEIVRIFGRHLTHGCSRRLILLQL